ncbi:glutamate-5-semialdehyde dehydrogenase [Ulvibacterium marinum]|uniref:Gamma-glutamyl phosphate reductase n=1 Tax=Ulvibacterium marinum TaxID=2419782 RepID=A0A3B0CDF8_9FLAO|nr:glutamate-5-semialdehyde dehydrogenase [Ulvibacterium marinum]RKN83290.1 glutamate-5-semialdehyde dehydrogenase [Ulvibacterium marinum]
MSLILDIEKRNAVLATMADLLKQEDETLLSANAKDMASFADGDIAMRDRLKVNDAKIGEMLLSLKQLEESDDPLGIERYRFTHENGMQVSNKTAPFGTVLIIYESRPDVTIEAAGIAFKSGNRILLKGGKESLNSNLVLVDLWHKSLRQNGADTNWVEYLQFDRTQTQAFLENPTQNVDLIVPRGGERLIAFVKQHASCPVIVSGRGNNFVYIHKDADLDMAMDIIINAKTTKISACNALDKVLINNELPNKEAFIKQLLAALRKNNVEILGDDHLAQFEGVSKIENESIWHEEFLDYKIVLGEVPHLEEGIIKINRYSGGHSASIITQSNEVAEIFMNSVDSAAVYHNASTRFTDGGQFGLGGELAISTDKLHQRGPIGLQHLVSNKWYVRGNGQIR